MHLKQIDLFLNSDFTTLKSIIKEKFDCDYSLFLARKGVEKIYKNNNLDEVQKDEVIILLMEKYDAHRETIENLYLFLKTFSPLIEKMKQKIANSIKKNFSNSLLVFYFCLSSFVGDNPNIIGTAKEILIQIAKDELVHDIDKTSYRFSILLDNIYFKNKDWFNWAYSEAIKIGVILEKYEAICFENEYIKSIAIEQNRPIMNMELVDKDFEYGLQCGNYYHNYVVKKRYEEEPGIIESFYKCELCKFSTFADAGEEDKNIAFEMLHRQFANRNLTDVFFFFTGDFQSYILSIISCIYTHYLLMYLFSTKTMDIIKKSDIKKKMFWGNVIDNNIFDECYRLVISDKNFNKFFIVINDDILLGRWLLDLDMSIIDLSKRIALNSKTSSIAGNNANNFGKNIYEKIIRDLLQDRGWKVVPNSIKLKEKGKVKTDVDLIAYYDGIVILGQIKLANTGRNRYDVWKSRKHIDNAISQITYSLSRFSQDKNLLNSILRQYSMCKKSEQIFKLVPVVITNSEYYIGEEVKKGIPVVSMDMFFQIVESMGRYNTYENIDRYFSDLSALFSFGIENKTIISEIENDDYVIMYEEFSVDE